ncbi:hypothetical protein NEOLEDRAFT_1135644 [Neolentinus lepideus HHB14362 ss-1]|uniref:Uncharacterized protein n=1 Tax=Neolentinus lepideus HHB14362 ss-1 TaxID=1314782 RepID=A0A165RP91_9AGAM|nr:hypothetical protein NEOLEDRAFT_1135644 [Neolentinus lepideus HHB14362 ss-1]
MSIDPSKANSSSTESFFTSLVTNVGILVLVVEVGAFTILKQRLGRILYPADVSTAHC